MDLLIADGRERGDDHVKAVEPRPPFDVMKPRHADESHYDECDCNQLEVSEDAHELSLAVGQRKLSPVGQQPTAYALDYETEMGVTSSVRVGTAPSAVQSSE